MRSFLRDDYQDLVRAGRVVVMDRFLSAAELQAAFCALDLHLSVYHRFAGLSSLMLKSLAAGVPVIANDHGWARAVVRRFEVGRTVDPADTTGFASALSAGLTDSADLSAGLATTRLLAFHSVENFTAGSSKGSQWQQAGRCRPRYCLGLG
jgi:glycosyltransferase involved in cell wall biosynthesis